MMLAFIAALILGAVGGIGADELLRGRDPRSRRVVVSGIVGAMAGLLFHRSGAIDGGWLLDALSPLVGAIALAFATRVRVSSAIPHPSEMAGRSGATPTRFLE